MAKDLVVLVVILMMAGVVILGCRAKPASRETAATDNTKVQSEDVSVTSPQPSPIADKKMATPQEKQRTSGIVVSSKSVDPGTAITKKGEPLHLMGAPLELGATLPAITLRDVVAEKDVNTSSLAGKVLIISVVPAISTPVCTAQSRFLEMEGDRLSPDILRITLSRDPPASLRSFAMQMGDPGVRYLSDHESGRFGRSSGLSVKGADILARAVIVVDKAGVVRHIQVVPEITQLPDMTEAFRLATNLNATSN